MLKNWKGHYCKCYVKYFFVKRLKDFKFCKKIHSKYSPFVFIKNCRFTNSTSLLGTDFSTKSLTNMTTIQFQATDFITWNSVALDVTFFGTFWMLTSYSTFFFTVRTVILEIKLNEYFFFKTKFCANQLFAIKFIFFILLDAS